MLGTWDIELGGATHTVTVERTESGKDMVRVDGRVAAKPMAADEPERNLSVAGYPYVLRRTSASTFALDADDQAEAMARNFEQAQIALAQSKNAPIGLKPPTAMNPMIIVWGALVVGVIVLMVMLQPPSYEKVARARVHQMLFEMQSGNGAMMQLAVTLWAKNARTLDNSALSAASDGFDKWRQQKELYNKGFAKFDIVKSELVKSEAVPTALVTFTLDGKQYTVRVPDKAPISWEN
jgi:hypothetical protein